MSLSKEHFKAELKRLKEQTEIEVGGEKMPCKFIIPPFMISSKGISDNLYISLDWWNKWYSALSRNEVEDAEMSELVNFALARRARNIGKAFFPTDDELRRLLEEMRQIRRPRADDKAPVAAQTRGLEKVNARRSHLQMISCSDCAEVHKACTMCPRCYPELKVARTILSERSL